jgi:predicted cupin superfamily sugar epimerase
MNAGQLIKQLELCEHPDGGYYRETFRSNFAVHLKNNPHPDRVASTMIMYLLSSHHGVSMLHRLTSDEQWHFYHGQPVTLVILDPQTSKNIEHEGIHLIRLGHCWDQGEVSQYVVPAGCWFGAIFDYNLQWEKNGGPDYSLVGCSVAPGFEFSDFEAADRAQLISEFPKARALIERMTTRKNV